MFIKTVPEAEAEDDLREIYDGDLVAFGFAPDHARVFSPPTGGAQGLACVPRQHPRQPAAPPLLCEQDLRRLGSRAGRRPGAGRAGQKTACGAPSSRPVRGDQRTTTPSP